MSEKMFSRRGAFSLLGLAAAVGFAVPTSALMTSDAEAQAQPTAPAPPSSALRSSNVRYGTASRAARKSHGASPGAAHRSHGASSSAAHRSHGAS